MATALINVVTMVLSVCVHEFSHALAAFKLDDDTAAREGRLTLNPFAHADPVGTVLLPAVAPFIGFGTFGWGKPVPYVPTRLSRRVSMRAGEAIIAFAGPLANLLMGLLASTILMVCIHWRLLEMESPLMVLLWSMIGINFLLFFFNLVPVSPFDGSKIFAWIGGQKADRTLDAIQDAGTVALIVAVVAGGFVAGFLAGQLRTAVFWGLSFVLG